MSSTQVTEDPTQSRALQNSFKFFGLIERIGNLLPNPFWLFWILSGILAVMSAIFAATGMRATNPATGKDVVVQNMLTGEGLQMVLGTRSTTSRPSRRWPPSSPSCWASRWPRSPG